MRLKLLLTATLLCGGVAAHADTLSTFSITGSAVTYGLAGDHNTITGTTTIDVTTGLVEAISFTAGGEFETGVYSEDKYLVDVGSPDSVFTFTGTTLVGYTGSTFNLRGPNDFYVGHVELGSTTTSVPASSVTPEPSSFVLLGTGLLGFAGEMKRRFV